MEHGDRADPTWGHSSAGRAPALQAGGRRFDPDWLHHPPISEARSAMMIELAELNDDREAWEKSRVSVL